jgi:hypothetical protein
MFRRNASPDLPIYGPDTQVLFSGEIFDAQDLEQDSFARAIRVEAPRLMGNNLLRILNKADRHLERIARTCGAQLLEHTWGLYDASNEPADDVVYQRGNRPESLGIPDDHIVVAKVPVIRSVRRLTSSNNPISEVIKNKTEEYYDKKELFKLDDLEYSQFVTGSVKPPFGLKGDSAASLFLVDLDVLWYRSVLDWESFKFNYLNRTKYEQD